MTQAVDKLLAGQQLVDEELLFLLQSRSEAQAQELRTAACAARDRLYGRRVFLRGLIEISSHCRNNCLYCGIRRGNGHAERYRLTPNEILSCCKAGYTAGLRTFVLQGGEDPFFADDVLCRLIADIKAEFPDCAVTLSLGERDENSYRLLCHAGADRYLLRHETADPEHYRRLHPDELSWQNRMACLAQLKALGYQVGCGFMVGSPGQKADHLARDLAFIRDFRPHMVGVGPFLPHKDTPFAKEPAGSVELTLYLLSIIRLLLPDVLLPATTALGTAAEDGQLRGLAAGANVIMPNLSPEAVRGKYMLYDGKKASGSEAAEGIEQLEAALLAQDYTSRPHRGDCLRP